MTEQRPIYVGSEGETTEHMTQPFAESPDPVWDDIYGAEGTARTHSDAPQEGLSHRNAPTTPQTEAHYEKAVPDLLRILVEGSRVDRKFREAANRWIDEAAAGAQRNGALPSVGRLAEALATVWPEEHGMEGIVNATHRLQARQIADALAAAPPEASER
jgi:hypothetical protein